MHNNGESLDQSKINDFIDGNVSLEETEDFNVLGVSKYTENNVIHTDFVLSNLDSEKYEDIVDSALAQAYETYDSNTRVSALRATPRDHVDSHTFRIHDRNTLAGIYTSNVDYLYKGEKVLNGRNVSIWDVKYFNQSIPKNSYQTREIITRFSVKDWANQTLRSYGPFSSSSNASVTVGLSGFTPNVSWTFNLYSSSVKDDSSLSEKYARWIFKLPLGTSTAKNTFVMKPGARITNAVGQVGFKSTHNIDYYKNLNSQKVYNTGSLTRYLNDR